MDKKTFRIIPFMGGNEKWIMWSVKSMARYGIKGYDLLLPGDKIALSDDTYETKVKRVSELKLLNKTAYNELRLEKEDTVCFQIFEEAKTKANKYGDAGQAWIKISRKSDPTSGSRQTL